MTFSGLVVTEGKYKTSLFKDKDLKQIPNGYCVVKQQFFGLNHSDLQIKNGTIGLEGSGIVEYVCGESSRKFEKGDKVCYYIKTPLASYEKVILHESGLMKVTSNTKMELAACARKFLTAHYLLQKIMSLKKDYWILISGASGGLGSIMTAWANNLGLNVIAVVSSDEKKQYALQNGAKIAINYKKEKTDEIVMEVTNGFGVLNVYDVLGKDFYLQSLKCLSYFGNYILTGGLTGFPEVNFNELRERSLSIKFPNIDHYKHIAFENIVGGMEFFEFLSKSNFNPTITSFHISKFESAAQALLNKARVGLVVCSFEES